MKRILSIAAFAALLLGIVSCHKQITNPSVGGVIYKTISVDLGDPATRASSALSGEGAIEDATLFVWQTNGTTGETTLYQKAYAEASTFDFELLFSDQTDYTYTINAWANMGELDAEPADTEILFSNEAASGLQMKGSRSGIDQASAAAVTIDMKRFAGKITVAEVALEWTNDQNALQDFTLKSIYVANAGDKAEGATAAYNNVNGAYASSAMDAMLYSPVNSVIADGAKYDTAQMMYAYGSGSTAIVLECDLGGQTMYYHVDYEPEWNTHRVFKFTVRQAGADSPLGDLPEEALETNVTTLNVLDWNEDEQEADFGDKVTFEGISIQHIDGTLYSADEWQVAETAGVITDEEANGVVVGNGSHAFVIHPTARLNQVFLCDGDYTYKYIENVFTTFDSSIAITDFNGKANTEAFVKAYEKGQLNSIPPIEFCVGTTFKNSKTGYLLSAGELYLISENIDEINNCLRVIGGVELEIMLHSMWWTSTQEGSLEYITDGWFAAWLGYHENYAEPRFVIHGCGEGSRVQCIANVFVVTTLE